MHIVTHTLKYIDIVTHTLTNDVSSITDMEVDMEAVHNEITTITDQMKIEVCIFLNYYLQKLDF